MRCLDNSVQQEREQQDEGEQVNRKRQRRTGIRKKCRKALFPDTYIIQAWRKSAGRRVPR